MFSPYYAMARRRHGGAKVPAEQHCALNLSLYRRAPGAASYQRLWAMTERGAGQLQRSATRLAIGPSQLRWAADGLHIDVDEWTVPWPQRLRGHIHLQPGARPGPAFKLDGAGRHIWQAISPLARVSVSFQAPALRWEGEAYLDCNQGSRPLERDFDHWHWSRERQPDGRCRVLYDLCTLDGQHSAMDLQLQKDGQCRALAPDPPCPLPSTAWGIQRSSRAPADATPRVTATLESGPFYARSLLVNGNGGLAVHESLSLRRFASPLVQAMLPFRMPRRAGAR
ncbi:carotenoid 1,2-hydratase [Roseateles toxinivorans]|uniref:Hydroxyneurosporene synthase n=1 Tax=Roseateles toxinivorans TaxID=270368 RepID=A0A4R6QR25_9BURK|nr:carotenoid 1,2-hydratase [Roseateles toxinivorans]TDP71744.1 hydroxyneurosporene synthase [Roseateles toxinivorans]